MPSPIYTSQSRAICRGKLINNTRKPCDHDFTLEFNSKPPKPEAYDYICPKCGNTGQFRRVL